MVKNSSMGSDIDFVKEFEELKLKQRLLIETLSKKNKTDRNSLLMEISSKLDFLVKIFKEATESENDTEHLDSKFKELDDKVSALSTEISTRFDELEEKLSKLEITEKKKEKELEAKLESSTSPIPGEIPPPSSAPVEGKNKTEGDKDAVEKKEGEVAPPEKEEKKKKKWF